MIFNHKIDHVPRDLGTGANRGVTWSGQNLFKSY